MFGSLSLTLLLTTAPALQAPTTPVPVDLQNVVPQLKTEEDRPVQIVASVAEEQDRLTARFGRSALAALVDVRPTGAAGPGVAQANWQSQFDALQARRSSGKKKVLLGLIGIVGGTLGAQLAAEDCVEDAFNSIYTGEFETCSGNASVMYLGYLAATGGTALGIWGGVQWADANSQLSSLGPKRSPSPAAIAVPLGDNHGVKLALGTNRSLTYNIGW